jgi:hypothetical protein
MSIWRTQTINKRRDPTLNVRRSTRRPYEPQGKKMHERESARAVSVANVILAGGGLFCLLCLLYVVHRYGLTGQGQFVSDVGPLVYYLVPGVSSVLLFGSLLLSPSIKVGLALVLSSTAISLYSVEVILQVVNHLRDRDQRTLWTPTTQDALDELVRIARKQGVTYDTRSKFEVVMDLRSSDPGVFPAIVPKALLSRQSDGTLKSRIALDGREVLVLGGISNRTTVFCNESGEWITYLSDEHGFHNPAGIWNRSDIDVVVIGDSYAQGACVPSDGNPAAVIRSRYPATLNLGMLGNGPLMELAQLKEYVARFKPKVVLWFFYEQNDFADLETERNSPLLMSYLTGPFRQDLLALQPEIDEALEDYVAGEIGKRLDSLPRDERPIIGTAIRTVAFLGNLRQRLGLAYGSRSAPEDQRAASDETMELLGEVFTVAKATVTSWGGKLYLVYLPDRARYTDAHAVDFEETNRETTLRLARELGIAVIDIHSAIQSHDDPLSLFPFRRRGHFNEDGYRLIAESALEAISHHE